MSLNKRLKIVEDNQNRISALEKAVGRGVTVEMMDDILTRLSKVEGTVSLNSVSTFIESQIQDDESYEDARLRVNDEFDYLNTKGKSNPLEGDEYIRYKKLTKGLGKS